MSASRRCVFATAAASALALSTPVAAQTRPPAPPPLFSELLPNLPGQRIRVDRLTLRDAGIPSHRHAGSVYIYVLEGTALLQIEGQPPREVRVGESFFEPAGALHTLARSAEAGRPAVVLAVTIAPDGAPGAVFEAPLGDRR